MITIFSQNDATRAKLERLKTKHLVVAEVTGDVLDGRVSQLVFFERGSLVEDFAANGARVFLDVVLDVTLLDVFLEEGATDELFVAKVALGCQLHAARVVGLPVGQNAVLGLPRAAAASVKACASVPDKKNIHYAGTALF